MTLSDIERGWLAVLNNDCTECRVDVWSREREIEREREREKRERE